MRLFFLAICCAATAALVPTAALTQATPYVTRIAYDQRPPPPTEPSITVAEKPAVEKLPVAMPKPAVQQKIVRRPGKGPGKGPTGPITTPSADVLVMMVRAALAGVNQANFTENYSVLHGMTTPGLQTRVTPAQFGKAFGSLRKQNLDLSPALVLQPQFSAPPSVSPQGVLRLAGFFPSRPLQINFAIDYLPIDGFWLIDGLSVSAMQAPADTMASAPSPAPALAPVASLATPAKPAAATPPQRTMTFARFGFWEPRFTKTTQFGPGLRFASSP